MHHQLGFSYMQSLGVAARGIGGQGAAHLLK